MIIYVYSYLILCVYYTCNCGVRLSRLTVVFVSAVFSLAASTCNYVQFEAHDLKLNLASFMMDRACLVRLATGVLLTLQVSAAFLLCNFSLIGHDWCAGCNWQPIK